MEQTLYLNFIFLAKNAVEKIKLTRDEQNLVFYTVDALIRGDGDRLEELLTTHSDKDKADVIRLASAVIDNLRLEAENEIIEKGDYLQLERLREIVETKDEAIAKAIDDYQKLKSAGPPKIQASAH